MGVHDLAQSGARDVYGADVEGAARAAACCGGAATHGGLARQIAGCEQRGHVRGRASQPLSRGPPDEGLLHTGLVHPRDPMGAASPEKTSSSCT